jgi:hypothetical protein
MLESKELLIQYISEIRKKAVLITQGYDPEERFTIAENEIYDLESVHLIKDYAKLNPTNYEGK